MTKEKLYSQQIDIIRSIQSDGYNVVQCGNCGGVVLVSDETKTDDECIMCPHCLEHMALSDCEDLFYYGMWIPGND